MGADEVSHEPQTVNPRECQWCHEGEYRLVIAGNDLDNAGDLRIKNTLGVSIQPDHWDVWRCPQCYHIQLFRRPG